LLSSRLAVTLVFLGAAAVLAAALLAQFVGGLAPCELCLYERWPYYVALPLGLALAAPEASARDVRGGAILLLLIFLASAALGFYHVGVEQKLFAGPTACTNSGIAVKSIDDLRNLLLNQQPVRCDVPQWSFHGITLAALNLLASLVLAALAAAGLRGRA
jgi:disulfide bond formation protein DsbB